MTGEPKLRPRRLTIESNLKYFSLQTGVSSGSSLSMETEVEGDPSNVQFWDLVWREKKKLDIAVLTMEYARGAMTRDDYDRARNQHQLAYEKLIGRKPPDVQDP